MLRNKSHKISYEYSGRSKPDVQRFTTYENGQQKQRVVIQHESKEPGQITRESAGENNSNGVLGWIIILIVILFILHGGSGEESDLSSNGSQEDMQSDIRTAREIGEEMLEDVDEYLVRLGNTIAERSKS